jgi:uncharacterized phage protein (TIGR02218 family)
MLAITFNALPAFLITCQPDWQRRVTATFETLTSRDVGNSARENREELADTLRAALSYQTFVNATEAAAARAVLSAWDNRPVLCPFWPAEMLAADYADSAVQGGLRVWFEPDWSSYSINAGTSPTHGSPSSDCRVAPLIVGKFTDFPLRTILSGNDDELIEVSVADNSAAAYALAAKPVTLTNGTQVNSEDVPLLTVPFAWGANTGTVEVQKREGRVGFVREAADTFYAQAPRAKTVLIFRAMDSDETAYLLSLFATCGGSVHPFWCPAAHSLAAADRVYGRFYGDRLTISWLKPALAGELCEAECELLSLPTEQTIPAGETFGETIGPTVKRWFGYKIVSGSDSWHYTSRESSIVGPGGATYLPKTISHGQITEEINLVVNDCSLTIHVWPGCPFARLQQLNAEPMTVTIYEGTVDDPGDAEVIYTGIAQAPQRHGMRMTIKLRGPGSMLSIKGPRLMMQETCRAVLGDARCGKNLAAFTVSAELDSVAGGVYETDLSAASYADGYFRNGYAERVVGTYTQRIPIADSFDFGNGNLGLRFASAVTPAPSFPESGWALTAGCDGYFSTCGTKFSNTANFRGFPHIPRRNPSMIIVADNRSGKKS